MRTGKGRPLTTLSVSQTLTKVERINPNISGKEQPGRSWSRAKRETTGTTNALDFPTAAAVAEGIHAAWYLIRDALRGRSLYRAYIHRLALRRGHRLPSVSPSSDDYAVRQPLREHRSTPSQSK